MPATAGERVTPRTYTDDKLERVAFPLGGLGAGMVCIEGSGAFSHQSFHHRPELSSETMMFGAISVAANGGRQARLLEGPVPSWRRFNFAPHNHAGNGSPRSNYGLPHCRRAHFTARFPFAEIELSDPDLPVACTLRAWSPFVPGDADASSLPVAGLEYVLRNPQSAPLEAVFSFHARNPMTRGSGAVAVSTVDGTLCFRQDGSDEEPWQAGDFRIACDAPETQVDCRWFRGGWFDPLTVIWRHIADGDVVAAPPYDDSDGPSTGGSLYVPFALAPGETRTIRVRLAWYVPQSNIRNEQAGTSCCGDDSCKTTHQPWYAGKFADVSALATHWTGQYDALRAASDCFSKTLFAGNLPEAVVDAVSANLTILKSPTVLRQPDGRIWGWEGCETTEGCCYGSCNHVWNYAQAVPHLFPGLARGMREYEFNEDLDDTGHQVFRTLLPIRKDTQHNFYAAADGQLGVIMQLHREWRVSGDMAWLKAIWPGARRSLDYCQRTWDPDREGVLREPHHNTYDIEFWGPNGMCTSFYLGALAAAVKMAAALGEDGAADAELLARGRRYMETELFNGDYFIQQIQWQGLRAPDPTEAKPGIGASYAPEARVLLQREGPKYQYGNGCLADGVLGAWLAAVCGVGEILDAEKVRSHLLAVHRHNLRHDLSSHANPQRPTFAYGDEGGLLLCSWPRGGQLTLPFVYSDEVWTGIEYQVASHLILMGCVAEGLDIVQTCRARYDGHKRNPFNEYECGSWYARAMSSYGLLQAMTGVRYDALERALYVCPTVAGDTTGLICTATGYGIAGVRDGQPFLEVRSGQIPCDRIDYRPNKGASEA